MRASRASREGPAAPGRSGRRRETPPGVSGGGFGAAGLRHATVGASATRRLARPAFFLQHTWPMYASGFVRTIVWPHCLVLPPETGGSWRCADT